MWTIVWTGGILLLVNVAYGQNYWFKRYDNRDGLSFNNINCSVQDNKGFLWFGTWDGLNRFDGHEFKIFRTDDKQEKAIGNNFVSALYVGNTDTLWVGTHNGLWKYDATDETFTRLNFTFTKWIAGITDDHQGNLWMICNDQLVKYNLKSGAYHFFDQYYCISLMTAPNGDIWVGTNRGYILRYDAQTNLRTSFSVPGTTTQAAPARITKLFFVNQEMMLVGTEHNGLKRFEQNTGNFSDVFLQSPDHTTISVTDILQSGASEYWISTTKGIYVYDLKSGKKKLLSRNDKDPNSLSDNNIKDLQIDREGGIWVGCKYSGINYFNKKNGWFTLYATEDVIDGQQVVGQVAPDEDGGIWAATENDGLFFLDTNDNVLRRRLKAFNSVSGLFADGDKLWFGSGRGTVVVANRHSGNVIHQYNTLGLSEGIGTGTVNCFSKTANGMLIGTTDGMLFLDAKTERISVVSGIPRVVVSSLFRDHAGGIWVGTYFSGLYYIDPKTMSGVSLPIDFAEGGKFNNTVTSIMEDGDHRMWFSTEGRGVVRYEPKQQQVTFLTTDDGLPSNNTFKILRSNNWLWISTAAGLCKLDSKSGAIQIFNRSNGLPIDQFAGNSGYITKDGIIYFGSTQGLVGFHSAMIAEEVIHPPLFITGIQVDNLELPIGSQAALKKSIVETKTLTLPYDSASLSIDFAALSYRSPELTQYSYRLEGLESGWTKLKTNRRVYFTKLPPGEYTFQVKAATIVGRWGREQQLKLIITPPWWLSSQAYFLYVLFGCSVVLVAFRYYQKRIQEKHERMYSMLNHQKDKEIYEAKIDFFTNIAHEIRTPLTLIMAPLEKIEQADKLEEAKYNANIMHKNADRLVKLTNQLLDFRKVEQRELKLNFVKTDVRQLLVENFDRFKLSAEMQGIAYQLTTDHQPLYAYVDPEALTKIIVNLLKNALKYGEQVVTVNLATEKEKSVEITVRNDGPLIPEPLKEKIFEPFYRLKTKQHTEGTGIGLALSRSLAAFHHGSLEASTAASHNVFTLTLPIHQEIEFDLDYFQEDLTQETEVRTTTEAKKHILIVEDNKEIMRFLFQELRNDYHVHTAGMGVEALDVLHRKDINLIISDVMMPEMDGFELCNRVKSDINFSHIPVILLTAKSSVDAKIEGLELGADAYIEKPFSPMHVKAQINSLLLNRAKIMHHFAISPAAEITTIAPSKADDILLNKLNAIILENLENVDLDVDGLASMLHMSRRNLYRKIKAVSGISPQEMIILIRLKKAAELLRSEDLKIYEIAMQTGFKSPDTFTRNFIKQFGVLPTEYAKKGS
ncbi:two-component regulator propeller domain-containing protein [Olivibacter ginsenosidimutans]|uniref:histidine kinase n=1 Tax=Olivibacter ginsenosidimutans TaxID=1176537 RepID=A0ABP9CI88_9SPHI